LISREPVKLGVVLDLDGTLVDSLDGLCVAAARAVGHVQRPVPSRDAIASYIGTGVQSLLHRALTGDLDGTAEEEIFQRAFKVFTETYYESCIHGTSLRQHAIETLAGLRAEGRGMAILTNKPSKPTRRILEHLELMKFFDVVFSPEDVGVRKPDPKGITNAMEKMDVASAVMVGDSSVDMETAIAAGVPFVGIRGGYHAGTDLASVVSAPHVVIDELDGLPEAIYQIESSL
jgi:phosphoglycolate phosphatase